MSKKRRSSSKQTTAQNNTIVMGGTKVRIANGAGRQPIVLDYVQGETFEELFNRANVWPREGQIVTYGKKQVKHFGDLVEPGTTITIANQPNNG